jgi:sugar/nucleoside kinase (ribokinase family)
MKTTLKLLPSPKKVSILGNLNIDLIIRGVPRLPEWGQEVIGSDYSLVSSGQSAYTALALNRYHIPVSIVSNVGSDIYGEKIIADLKSAGVNMSAVEKTPDGQTGITVAVVRKDGERAFVSDPSCLSHLNRSFVERKRSYFKDASLVCLVGLYFLPGYSIEDAAIVFKELQLKGKTTVLDTGWDPANWQTATVRSLRQNLKYFNIFIPNLDEARAITGLREPEKAIEALMNDGPGIVIIKMGADGSLGSSGKGSIHIPIRRTTVLDAVGAGDVYNAGFILGTLQNWPLEARMILGTITSSLYISKRTNRFPTLEETLQTANKWQPGSYKFLSMNKTGAL